jgi:hypothetical protein
MSDVPIQWKFADVVGITMAISIGLVLFFAGNFPQRRKSNYWKKGDEFFD